jgi:hypothetical protein
MNHQLLGSAAVVLALTTAIACEKRTNDDATSRTETTSAEANRDSAGEDLRQAGKKLGSAAEKTAAKAAEKVKDAAEKLDDVKVDVKVGDKDACNAGVDDKGRACDGGAAKPRP